MVVRLRVEDVDEILVVDGERDPARIAELVPLRDERAGLIEDLNPGVTAIGDEYHALSCRWRCRAPSGTHPVRIRSFPTAR